MPTIEDRLAALETSVRRWRHATVGLVLILAVGATAAAALQPEVPEVIKARKVEVVDEQGMTVVHIGSWQMGGSISVWGRREPDKAGTLTTRISHADNGDGLLRVKSKAGEDLLTFGSRNGSGLLTVLSHGGSNIVVAGGDGDGNGRLTVNSQSGEVGAALLGRGLGGFGGAMAVLNSTGGFAAAIAVDKNGSGNVSALDREGKGRALKPGP